MSILKRLEQAIASGRRAIEATGAAPQTRSRTALMLMGANASRLGTRMPPDVSVLITDSRDVADYQLTGVATEYIPRPDSFPERFDTDDCLAYTVRRLALLRVKWRLGKVYLGGEGAKMLADAWIGDPEGPRPSFFRTFALRDER